MATKRACAAIQHGADPGLRRGIFYARSEVLLLALPLLVLLVSGVLDYYRERYAMGPYAYTYLRSYLFMASTHAILTALLLCFLPAVARTALPPKSRKGPFPHLMLLVLISTGTPLLCWHQALPGEALIAFVVFITLLNLQHSIGQFYGFSALYNQAAVQTLTEASERKRAFSLSRQEKWLGKLLAFLTAAHVSLRLFWPDILQLLMWPFFFAFLLVTTTWIYRGWQSPAARTTNKMIYLSRLLVFPLAAFSRSMLDIVTFMHGLEYLLLSHHLIDRALSPAQKARFWSLFVVFSAILGWMVSMRPEILGRTMFPDYAHASLWITIPAALSLGIAYTHFWCDRRLFSFSDPAHREGLLKLLQVR